MDHALPVSVSFDLRPWLWALAITLLASALMLLRIHWAYAHARPWLWPLPVTCL